MFKAYFLVLAAWLAAVVATHHDQTILSGDNRTGFSDYVDYLMKIFRVPAISLAIVRLGQDAELLNWGQLDEDGTESSEDSLYALCSCSKAFLSTSLGILMADFESGRNVTSLPANVQRFDWNTKIKHLLPEEWELQDYWASSKASLRDILSHVSGVPGHDMSYTYEDSIPDLLQRIRYIPSTYELREQPQYSNQMFIFASYIVAKYSNQTYTSFVKQRLFEPLGMTSSTFDLRQAHDTGTFMQSFINNAGPTQNESRRIPFLRGWSDNSIELLAAPGGVISSSKDLVHWLRTLLNNGKLPGNGTRVIPSSVLDVITSGQNVMTGKALYPEGSASVLGLGWVRASYQGHELLAHGGGAPGSSSFVVWLPNDGLGIAALSNGDAVHPALNSAIYRIIEDTFGLPRVDWPARYLARGQSQIQKTAVYATAPVSMGFSIEALAGTYKTPAYAGNLTLCAWSPTPSDLCASALADYAAIDPDLKNHAASTLYAAWGRVWGTHLRLSHRTGKVFELWLEDVFPEGFGRDKEPFFVRRPSPGEDKDGYVEFEIREDGEVEGLLMWGVHLGGDVTMLPYMEDPAAVWFDKVV